MIARHEVDYLRPVDYPGRATQVPSIELWVEEIRAEPVHRRLRAVRRRGAGQPGPVGAACRSTWPGSGPAGSPTDERTFLLRTRRRAGWRDRGRGPTGRRGRCGGAGARRWPAPADAGAFLARLVRLDPAALVRLRPAGADAAGPRCGPGCRGRAGDPRRWPATGPGDVTVAGRPSCWPSWRRGGAALPAAAGRAVALAAAAGGERPVERCPAPSCGGSPRRRRAPCATAAPSGRRRPRGGSAGAAGRAARPRGGRGHPDAARRAGRGAAAAGPGGWSGWASSAPAEAVAGRRRPRRPGAGGRPMGRPGGTVRSRMVCRRPPILPLRPLRFIRTDDPGSFFWSGAAVGGMPQPGCPGTVHPRIQRTVGDWIRWGVRCASDAVVVMAPRSRRRRRPGNRSGITVESTVRVGPPAPRQPGDDCPAD